MDLEAVSSHCAHYTCGHNPAFRPVLFPFVFFTPKQTDTFYELASQTHQGLVKSGTKSVLPNFGTFFKSVVSCFEPGMFGDCKSGVTSCISFLFSLVIIVVSSVIHLKTNTKCLQLVFCMKYNTQFNNGFQFLLFFVVPLVMCLYHLP